MAQPSDITIAPLGGDSWTDVRRIYSEGIATGQATFETRPREWDEWNAGHLAFGRLIALEHAQVVGWAALSPVSSRSVYSGVAEVSVYVDARRRGAGIGTRLLARLILESEEHGVWTLQAGIFPENVSSVRVHQRLGFREVGRRERVGRLAGRWRDVLLLERRSQIVGADESNAL